MNPTIDRKTVFKAFKKDGALIVYTPDTGVTTPPSYNTYGFMADYRISEIDGTLVIQGDRKIYMAALDDNGVVLAKPQPEDKLEMVNETMHVVYCEPIAPVGVPIFYKVQVRKQ